MEHGCGLKSVAFQAQDWLPALRASLSALVVRSPPQHKGDDKTDWISVMPRQAARSTTRAVGSAEDEDAVG
jgi:hypothetical protein